MKLTDQTVSDVHGQNLQTRQKGLPEISADDKNFSKCLSAVGAYATFASA